MLIRYCISSVLTSKETAKAIAHMENININNFQEQESIYDEAFLDDNGKLSGKKFAYYLETEGSKVLYNNDFPPREQLPTYYDEAKFKTAQEVFQKFKANLCMVKLIGLIVLLVHATAIKIIMMTKRSNEPSTAKVRYKETFKHVLTWYSGDFSASSELWSSINRVRQMHHAANLQASKYPDIQQITQFELAGTVVGFIGFAIIKPNQFGMSTMSTEELEALVHFWRIIGYLMGVEDRFNVCRESLDETKEIVQGIVDVHVKSYMKLKDADSLNMQFAAVQGIGEFMAPLFPKCLLNFAYELVFEDSDERLSVEFPLSISERLYGFMFRRMINNLHYEYFRNIINNFIDNKINENTNS